MEAKWHTRRAFTLVELLVVIAIVAILASLLLPALSRAKAGAHSAKCKSNLKQLALGLAMYVQDHNGEFPLGYAMAGVWDRALAPYAPTSPPFDIEVDAGLKFIRGQGVFRCPGHAPSPPPGLLARLGSSPGPGQFAVTGLYWFQPSYGYNATGSSMSGRTDQDQPLGLGGAAMTRITGMLFSTANIKPTREACIVNPARMLALGDGYQANGRAFDGAEPFFQESGVIARDAPPLVPDLGRDYRTVKRRHAGKLNMAFCDGHVESDKIGKWFFSTRDEDLALWNTDNQPR